MYQSLLDIVVIIGKAKPATAPRNRTLHLCFFAQNGTARPVRPYQRLKNRGRISSLILTTTVRRIARDSRRKSSHNIVDDRKSSLVIIHNTRRRTPLAR